MARVIEGHGTIARGHDQLLLGVPMSSSQLEARHHAGLDYGLTQVGVPQLKLRDFAWTISEKLVLRPGSST